MVYVLDTSVLSALHRNYYRDRFPTLWKRFDQLILDGHCTSTREVYREIEDYGGALLDWAHNNNALFVMPNAAEGAFVAQIYAIPHFQANIERQKLYKGGKNADPFVVARAAVLGGMVVTMEKLRENAAKIPNICHNFRVDCTDLEGFMEMQGWTF